VTNSNFLYVGVSSALTVDGALDNQSTAFFEIYGGTANVNAISNTGEVDILGGGTLNVHTLSNAGDVYIDSGATLAVGSSSPADTGYVQLADGTWDESIISGSDFGRIYSNGPAALAGTLDVLLQGGFEPTIGDTFVILGFAPGTLNGTFSSIGNDVFNNGTEQWAVTYDNVNGQVLLTAEAFESNQTPEPPAALPICCCLLAAAYRVRSRRTREAG
jgi:hypothetical protein